MPRKPVIVKATPYWMNTFDGEETNRCLLIRLKDLHNIVSLYQDDEKEVYLARYDVNKSTIKKYVKEKK